MIDEALNTIKTNADPAARKAAAETINKQFGSQVYNFWLSWVLWGIISQPYVHGVQANKLPDGSRGDRPRLRRPAQHQPDVVRQRQVRRVGQR